MREMIKNLMEKYEDVKDAINLQKANGDLARLCNLRTEFDETFDAFFDRKELRVKYDAWNIEEDDANHDFSNADLLEKLDDADLTEYVEFLKNYIAELENQLSENE